MLTLREHTLAFARPFAASRFTLHERRILVLTAHDASSGTSARGEAAPLPEFGTESRDDAHAALSDALPLLTPLLTGDARLRAAILALTELTDPGIGMALAAGDRPGDAGWGTSGQPVSKPSDTGPAGSRDSGIRHLCERLAATPTARYAVECLLWERLAQLRRTSVESLLAVDAVPAEAGDPPADAADLPSSIPVNGVIAGGDVEASAAALLARGFSCIKMKVGSVSLEEDADRVRRLRAAAGPGILIRLDANGAWTEAAALEALERFARCRIEYLEQPVPPGDAEALRRVHRASPVPIAADESVTDAASARRLLACDAAAVYVIKPMALGGLLAARRIAQAVVAAGRDVVFTSLLDGWIGRRGTVRLAASLASSCTRHHGLATGTLFASDLGMDVVRDGRLQV